MHRWFDRSDENLLQFLYTNATKFVDINDPDQQVDGESIVVSLVILRIV